MNYSLLVVGHTHMFTKSVLLHCECKCLNACNKVISKVLISISGGWKLLTLKKYSTYLIPTVICSYIGSYVLEMDWIIPWI